MSNINSTDSSNDSNKLIPGLYKLVSGLNRVKETSNVPSKDLLPQLDPNDTSELTTRLKERLTKSLGPLVEKEIEKHNQALISNTEPGAIVNSISESLLESPDYKVLCSSLSDNLREATLSVIEEMELHSREGSLNNYLPVDTQTSESISLNLEYAYMPYISSNYLKELVIKFDTGNRPDVRRDALQAIIQFSPSEILACPEWPTLHMLVTRSLADTDSFISNNSFGILLRLFSTSNLTAIKEAYLILVEHLIETNTNSPLYIQCVKQGVDVCRPEIGGVMQKFHLLTMFIHWLPNYWFRFNNAFMSEIIDKTMDLLMLQIDRESLTSFSKFQSVSPIHILSIIDHKSDWFNTLLHSEYSRQFIVNKLEKHPTFLSTIVEYIVTFARQIEPNSPHFATDTVDVSIGYYYNEDSLNYLLFIASLKIMQNVLIFECRQLLFPNSFDGEYFKLNNDAAIHFITTLLDKLFSHSNCSVEKEFDPYYIILDTLMKALQRGRISDGLFSNGKIVTSLIQSVNRREGSTDVFRELNSHLYYVYEVLGCITECDMGKKLFISHGFENTNFIDLFTQTKALLKTIPTSPLPNTINTVLSPIINLLATPEGSQLEDTYRITQLISSLLKKPTFSQNSTNRDELIDILSNLTITPRGLLCLMQDNFLDECIEFLFLKNDLNLHSYKKGCARYGFLLSQISNFPCSAITLEHTGIFEYLTKALVKLLKRTNEHLLYQQASLIAPLTRDVHKALCNLARVFVNYPTLVEILDRKSIMEVQETPLMPPIIQLLLDYVLVSPSEDINDISNFEEIHIICLSLLNLLLASLDNSLLLEESIDLTAVLISLQNYTATKNDVQMLDQLWYERNRALLKIGIIGGPSEKLHPANSLYCYEEIEKYMFSTYKDLPLPMSHSNFKEQIPWIPDGRKEFPTSQLELQNWFIKLLSSGQNKEISQSTQSLLQHVMSQTSDNTFPKNLTTFDSNIKTKLHVSEITATRLIVQYGVNHGLLREKESNEKQLISLMLNIKTLLVSQQISLAKIKTELNTLQSDTYCYDWFVGLVFILMQGDAQLTYTLLASFSTQLCSGYIWVNRLHKSKFVAQNQVITGSHWAITNLMQLLELIVKTELPNIHNAFQISGLCLSTICSIWVRQCFLNFLDLEEICNYILTVLIMGVDYQIYFIVSLLRHLEQDILSSTQENNLIYSILENPIRGFVASVWLEYMRELEDRWKGTVKGIFSPVSAK